MKIHLQPLGSVDQSILVLLKRELEMLKDVEVDLHPQLEMPLSAYNSSRRQFEGRELLSALPETADVILAVTEADTFVEGLNFIFGLAWENKALISLKRLRPEFYGLPDDGDLLLLRAKKEALHELGHVFGLDHCPDSRCVMFFSNSILDTDLKDWRYCPRCEGKVMKSRSCKR